MKTTTDVLIVGAGPVGLLLAAELSRDGVGVLLVERVARRSFLCKATGVNSRTLEIFDDLGIAQDAIDAGVWLRGVTFFNDGVSGPAMDLPAGGLPFGMLSLAQFETERLLEACLLRHGGAVEYGWTLSGFSIEADRVEAQLVGAGGETRSIECRWLVGCDGARSSVRATLGFPFEGARFPQSFVLADLEIAWDLPRGRMYRFSRGMAGRSTSLSAMPVHGNERRYRLSMALPDSDAPALTEATEAPTPPSLEQIAGFMEPLLPEGTVLSSLHWSSIYRVSHRIVPAYSKGRVFLAGDAAHVHPPVGGQGMNTGLQDAHNLAWKLVLASRGLAGQALLDSYSAERHPVGLDVVHDTTRALNDVLAQRAQLPGMRETQLLISYRGSDIVRDERVEAKSAPLAAGDRAPDAGRLKRAFVGREIRLHERLGHGRHVLVGFIRDDRAMVNTLADMLALLRSVFGESASGFAVVPGGCMPPEREDLPVLTDSNGEFAAAFYAQPGMAWLVRPDGHIGWCSAAPSTANLRSFLATIVETLSSTK